MYEYVQIQTLNLPVAKKFIYLSGCYLLVTEPATGPDLPDTGSLHLSANKVLLGAALHTDKVHATFPEQHNIVRANRKNQRSRYDFILTDCDLIVLGILIVF